MDMNTQLIPLLVKTKCPTQKYISTSPLEERQQDALSWSCVLMLYQRLLRTSELCVPEKKDSDTREVLSTV
ncbi:predicted protein [Chaetoceros tenuissimus]|uniref:Uncharacterized protein n=1 Tax=Chaetoceros tenuissimus TaxID=426638 RepID=A0AAD3CSW7_9STRA|nr:predicted protein [Chaetoceros tenuissimus]